MKKLLLLILLLLLVIINTCCIYWEDWMIQDHIGEIQGFVAAHTLLAPLLFILTYTVLTAFSVPIGAILSIAGGFLFPQPFSTLYVIIGATAGATLLFAAARTLFHETLEKRAAPYLERMRAGFQENEASYMLFLRLVPGFPFWLVNLAPAFLGIHLRTFVWTTALGIIPGAFIFTQAGAGLSTLSAADDISIDTIFNRDVKIALIALALFALLPAIIRKLKR